MTCTSPNRGLPERVSRETLSGFLFPDCIGYRADRASSRSHGRDLLRVSAVLRSSDARCFPGSYRLHILRFGQQVTRRMSPAIDRASLTRYAKRCPSCGLCSCVYASVDRHSHTYGMPNADRPAWFDLCRMHPAIGFSGISGSASLRLILETRDKPMIVFSPIRVLLTIAARWFAS